MGCLLWPAPPTNPDPSQVARLRFFVMGFRGDWKALKQVFHMDRNYNENEAKWLETVV